MSVIAAIAGGLASAVPGLIGSIVNTSSQSRENAISRSREDNAITRQIADLRNAGMSPLLASGQGASAQSMTAPQVNFDSVGKGIQQAIAIRQAQGQLDLLKSQKAQADSQAKLNSEMAKSTESQRDWNNVFGYHDINPTTFGMMLGYNGMKTLDENPDLLDGTVSAIKEGSKGVYDKVKGVYDKVKSTTSHAVIKSAAKLSDYLDKDHYYKGKGKNKRMIHVQE